MDSFVETGGRSPGEGAIPEREPIPNDLLPAGLFVAVVTLFNGHMDALNGRIGAPQAEVKRRADVVSEVLRRFAGRITRCMEKAG